MRHLKRSTHCKSTIKCRMTSKLTCISSIAKYTGDDCHLNRCDPGLPDPETPIETVFGSPKMFYATVADSIPDAKAARVPISKSSNDLEPLHLQTSPQQRNRASSRSASNMMMSASEQAQLALGHLSANQPRMFPGMIHERARRNSLKVSTGERDLGTLGPALAKMAVREEDEGSQLDDSD